MAARLAHEAAGRSSRIMTAIGILGANGRMGRAVARRVDEGPHASLAGGPDLGAAPAGLAARSDVLVDFSAPDALAANLAAAVAAGTPIVIGTTGLKPDHHEAIDAAAAKIAVLQTANTSLGIAMLRGLVEEAARRLGPAWDIEIGEM